MQVEQLTYTSCLRGATGRSSGFQIRSWSPLMRRWIDAGNAIDASDAYDAPHGPQYVDPPRNPEQLRAFPSRYVFGPVEGPDDLYRMMLGDYIGRDYGEGAVRGGNYLNHVTAIPCADIDDYPYRFIGSDSFAHVVDPEKTRADMRTDTLPPDLPSLTLRPNGITPDDVRRFLETEDRGGTLKIMLRCLMTRTHMVPRPGDPGETIAVKRRLVINDDMDHFTRWIAALELALPKRQSLAYVFSTYENDIDSCRAEVVRAVDGMRVPPGQLSQPAYVFDMTGRTPLPEPDDDGMLADLCDFLTEALLYAPQGLASFHRFLDATDYAAVDANLAAAYDLYLLVGSNMPQRFADMGVTRIANALGFCQSHCPHDVWHALANRIIAESCDTVFDADRRNLLGEALAGIAQEDAGYAPTARKRCLDALADVFTCDAPDQRLYEQLHFMARKMFDATGRDLDATLFERLAQNRTFRFDAAANPSAPLPWTVAVYADWAAHSIIADVTGGHAAHIGDSLETMVGALQPHNQQALAALGRIVVTRPQAEDTRRLLSELSETLRPAPEAEFIMMLYLLLLANEPGLTASTGDLVTQLSGIIAQRYINAPDELRKRMLLTLCATVNGDAYALRLLKAQAEHSTGDPSSFFAFWTAQPQLPRTFFDAHADALSHICVLPVSDSDDPNAWAQYASALTQTTRQPANWYAGVTRKIASLLPIYPSQQNQDSLHVLDYVKRLCASSSVPLPDRVTLIDHLHLITTLEQCATSRKSNPKAIRKAATQVCESTPKVRLDPAQEDVGTYIDAVAESLLPTLLLAADGYRAQAYALPRQFTDRLLNAVAVQAATTGSAEDMLILIAVDYGFVDKTQGMRLRADLLTSTLANAFVDAHVKENALCRIMQNPKRVDKLAERFERTYGIRFPERAFDENGFFDAVLDTMDKLRQQRTVSPMQALAGLFGRRAS